MVVMVVMVVMVGTVGTEVLFNVGERGSCLMRRGRGGCLTRSGSVLVESREGCLLVKKRRLEARVSRLCKGRCSTTNMRISGGLSISISQLGYGSSDLVDAPWRLLNQIHRKISILSNKLSESILSPEFLQIVPCYLDSYAEKRQTEERDWNAGFPEGLNAG